MKRRRVKHKWQAGQHRKQTLDGQVIFYDVKKKNTCIHITEKFILNYIIRRERQQGSRGLY